MCLCVCVWRGWTSYKEDKRDMVNIKLWMDMSSVSVRRSTIGYGRVSTREFGRDLTDNMHPLGKKNLGIGWEWAGVGWLGGTWYSPLETRQGNS